MPLALVTRTARGGGSPRFLRIKAQTQARGEAKVELTPLNEAFVLCHFELSYPDTVKADAAILTRC